MKIILLLFILVTFNCIPAYMQKTNGPVNGYLISKIEFPGEFNQNNDVKADKKAEGCLNQVFFLVMWGDAAAGSIALENGIRKVARIDHSTINVLGLYSRYCTIIRGE